MGAIPTPFHRTNVLPRKTINVGSASANFHSPVSFSCCPPINPMRPTFPQEIIDELVDWVAAGSVGQKDPHLRSCSLVSRNWVERSRQHLFHSIELASTSNISNWIGDIRPGACGVSRYAKRLWMGCNWDQWPRRFPSVEHLRSFTHVKELRLTYWCGGHATKEEVQEAFGVLGLSVRSLSVSLARGDMGSFLHLLSLFPHLEDLSIWTSSLEESQGPLPKNAVTVRRMLVLDGAQEHFTHALIGSGLKPTILKISIPHLISYDRLLTACALSVEAIVLSPTFGLCLLILGRHNTANFGRLRRMSRSHLSGRFYGVEARRNQVGAPSVLLRGCPHRTTADSLSSLGESNV